MTLQVQDPSPRRRQSLAAMWDTGAWRLSKVNQFCKKLKECFRRPYTAWMKNSTALFAKYDAIRRELDKKIELLSLKHAVGTSERTLFKRRLRRQ